MKTHLSSLLCLLAFQVCALVQAADDPRLPALQAADDARVAAMKAPTKENLAAILSEELHYCHANGKVDTNATFTEALLSGHLKYEAVEYQERTFTFPAPKIALMAGKAHMKAGTGPGALDAIMSYLAVWREENGHWHFLAWQSSKLPAKTP